ncbi:MAG: hypothetical protein IJD48_04290 [Clostridia bacterium]|nr:hypothetical protein [Clostridia bacterium]
MKGLKITNIILFSVVCIIQAYITYLAVPMLSAILSGDGGAVFGAVLGIFPLYLITVAVLIIFAVILTITSKAYNNKLIKNELPKSKFATICKALIWVFVLIDLVIILTVYVLPKN